MITVVVGKEIEKIKGDFESYLNGLNMVGEISYSQYSELYDEGTKQIQKAYELGKSELEEENAELKLKLKTAYRKGMRHMAKALKDYDRTDGVWTDYFEHTVDKVLQREQLDFEEYGTLADQLTKAKEILKAVVDFYPTMTATILLEAEQFLNSEVEK